MTDAVWPVVFVGWRSKGSELLEKAAEGKIDAWVGKIHTRKGARCIVALEDGTLLAAGEVSNVTGNTHELALSHIAPSVSDAPRLSGDLLATLGRVPKGLLKLPINMIVIPPDNGKGAVTMAWFDAAMALSARSLPQSPSSPATVGRPVVAHSGETAKQIPAAPVSSENPPTSRPEPGDEREALLTGWIPPALQGLLQDHVRADQWELIVAYAFQALGCQVKVKGHTQQGQAVPDCIARYTSPAGQIVELVIDAKAGRWNGAVDDVRAMRDYMALSNPYAYPLFVANTLSKDVSSRLREYVIHGKVARAITGRDLALLIVQRLTDANFNVELELRRLFL